ncbi:MAG: hypothetical protein RIR00_2333 [Pseudomonadota bacterium]|jgi:DNA-binding response OmpR family regulator
MSEIAVLERPATVARILVVDDEPLNLRIIAEYLEDEPWQLELVEDPRQAWRRLQQSGEAYAAVLLDRMMPHLNGMDFLRQMKADPRLARIPVLMQTAAAAPEQVREGLAAGAHYYLTKPFDPDALVGVIRAALEESALRARLQQELAAAGSAPELPQRLAYRFATLDEVSALVPQLARLAPSPETVATGLSELMTNAVEHGNLGISYQEKSLLKWENEWEAEVQRRQKLARFVERYATVTVERLPDRLTYTIVDQGQGFDWRDYLDFKAERAFDPNGRGIALARLLSFSSLEYRGAGNEVVATVALPRH